MDNHLENPQSWSMYNYTFNNPLKFFDEAGFRVKSIHLKINGQNGVNSRSQELGEIPELGSISHGGNFGFAVNIVVEITPDDDPANYNPVQTAFRLYPEGKNTDSNRPGESGKLMPDNPEKKNVERSGDKLIWLDNPGIITRNIPPAGVNGGILIFFTSTVQPKNEKKGIGQATDIIMYWVVDLVVKKGKIVRAIAREISKETYYKYTRLKEKKKKEKKKSKKN